MQLPMSVKIFSANLGQGARKRVFLISHHLILRPLFVCPEKETETDPFKDLFVDSEDTNSDTCDKSIARKEIPSLKSAGTEQSAPRIRRNKKGRQTKRSSDMAEGQGAAGLDVEKDEGQKNKDEKKFPNYLIAMQMTNPQIYASIQHVQETVISNNERLKPALQPIGLLHLTMFMMHLATEEEVERAKQALDQCRQELRRQVFRDQLLSLDISGLDNFGNRVVFAKVKTEQQEARLKEIADVIEECFADQGIKSAANHGGFAAHVTVFNLSRDKSSRRKDGIKKIDAALYKDYIDKDFGRQYVNSLQLCPMMKPKLESGYYDVEHTVQFGPDIPENVYG